MLLPTKMRLILETWRYTSALDLPQDYTPTNRSHTEVRDTESIILLIENFGMELLSHVLILLLPPPWRRLCFHRRPLLCLFVCLSVSRSVSDITEQRLNGFSRNLQGRWDLIQGTIRYIFRMFHLTPWTQDFFPLFRSNPCLLAALQKNGWTDFHDIFRKRRT